MMRLLQGDVGSGKTAVAMLALLAAAGSGWQGALMAPTEVTHARTHMHAGTHARSLTASTHQVSWQSLTSSVSIGLSASMCARMLVIRLHNGRPINESYCLSEWLCICLTLSLPACLNV